MQQQLFSIQEVVLQLDLFKKIIRDDLSVRQVEMLARDMQNDEKAISKKNQEKSPELSHELKQLQEKLSSHFGTKVSINDKGKRGELRIPFLSYEDLNRILEILNL